MEILEILATIDAENKDLINNINNYYLDKLYSSTKKESIVSTKEEFSHMQKKYAKYTEKQRQSGDIKSQLVLASSINISLKNELKKLNLSTNSKKVR